MKGLIEIINKSNTNTIYENKIVDSGTFKYDYQNEQYIPTHNSNLNHIDLKHFHEIVRDVPMKNGVLMLEDRKNKEFIFANLRNKEIKAYIDSKGLSLYRLIDRIVVHSKMNGLEEVIINNSGFVVGKDSTGMVKRVDDLKAYAEERTKQTIRMEMIKDRNVQDPRDLEINTNIQGVDIRFVYWENDLEESEIVIQLIDNTNELPDELQATFENTEGFILFNRDYSRHLSNLLNDRTAMKRIAYMNMRNMVSDDNQGHHFDLNQVSMESIRSKDFDVYVINLSQIEDHRELLAVPTNKLTVLVTPIDSNEKAVNFINLFKSEPMVRGHLVENLQMIVADLDSVIIFDNWSRELLKADAPDLEELVDKLQTVFHIRDKIKPGTKINIHEEIRMMMKRAIEVDASNIDIVPGSPIRLYQTKVEYIEYSDVKMTPNLTEVMVLNMIKPTDVKRLFDNGELDTSYSIPGVGRYRLGIVMQRSSLAISIRSVPRGLPTPEQLRLPLDFVDNVVKANSGITLIVGEPNSGKTVTFNCIIDEINRNKGGIMFLMGNPIEYTHRHEKALVVQIEIGHDLPSYTHGIAKSLRMNTTTLGFEELRTQEEFAALGTLINAPNAIFMTSHAPGTRQALEQLVRRIHESGVSEEKAQEDIANSLNYVMFQKLVTYKGERILLYEKLKATPQIKALIKNGNFSQLDSAIRSDKDCESFDDVILKRLEEGTIDFDVVRDLIHDAARFKMRGYI